MRWEGRAFFDTTARGRNGWFRAARLEIRSYLRDEDGTPSPRVVVDVASERSYGDMPPVHLDMAVKDALALHHLLGMAICAGMSAAEDGDLPSEPQGDTDVRRPSPRDHGAETS